MVGQNQVIINVDQGEHLINRHIYGHFSEHLGRCIYNGFYVGDNNKVIPNSKGMRSDIVNALKKLQIPNLRWLGGCFADTYHWKDGIGPKKERPTIVNTWWGGITEDNSFGTHEFLELCEQLETEPGANSQCVTSGYFDRGGENASYPNLPCFRNVHGSSGCYHDSFTPSK